MALHLRGNDKERIIMEIIKLDMINEISLIRLLVVTHNLYVMVTNYFVNKLNERYTECRSAGDDIDLITFCNYYMKRKLYEHCDQLNKEKYNLFSGLLYKHMLEYDFCDNCYSFGKMAEVDLEKLIKVNAFWGVDTELFIDKVETEDYISTIQNNNTVPIQKKSNLFSIICNYGCTITCCEKRHNVPFKCINNISKYILQCGCSVGHRTNLNVCYCGNKIASNISKCTKCNKIPLRYTDYVFSDYVFSDTSDDDVNDDIFLDISDSDDADWKDKYEKYKIKYKNLRDANIF